MAPPAAGARILAGHSLGPRLASDIYGDLHAASRVGAAEGAGDQAVHALVVAPALAADRAFVDRLTHDAAPRLHAFAHPAVVGTVLVAREGRELVVITEAVRDARSVVDLLAARAGAGGLPPRVVAAIARRVIEALAALHAQGLVHGAVHPRSVLVDRDGSVRLTDLAVGYAAMSAAAAGSEAMPLRGLSGFVSPEVALGDPPTAAADVYAAGALMAAMTSGSPTGAVLTTPALERLVRRALDTDLSRRFASAVELAGALDGALADDRVTPADAAELAEVWAHAGAALAPPVARNRRTSAVVATVDAGVAAVMAAGPEPRRSALDAVLFDLDDEPDPAPPPAVAPLGSAPALPVVQAQDALRPALEARAPALAIQDPMQPPEPPPWPPPPGPKEPSPEPNPDPVPDPAPVPVPEEIPTIARQTVAPPPAPPPTIAPATAPATTKPPVATASAIVTPEVKRRSFGWLWVAIIAVGAAALAFGLTRQKDELGAEERQARAKKLAAKAEQDELARRLRAAQADPGSLRVRSRPSDAGVWLLLGRAPFESIALGTDQPWQLRVELEGFVAQDAQVGAAAWTGDSNARRASLAVTLEPGAAKEPLPAIPAEPSGELARGVPGSGRLAVTSTPPGAAVWLLVGVTDGMQLDGIEAGRDYELKVTHDGFVPGFVRFAAEEWRAGGDPALPLSAAPKKPVLERTVELVAAPRSGKGR